MIKIYSAAVEVIELKKIIFLIFMRYNAHTHTVTDGRCCHGHNTSSQSARSAETKARSLFGPLQPSLRHAQRS